MSFVLLLEKILKLLFYARIPPTENTLVAWKLPFPEGPVLRYTASDGRIFKDLNIHFPVSLTTGSGTGYNGTCMFICRVTAKWSENAVASIRELTLKARPHLRTLYADTCPHTVRRQIICTRTVSFVSRLGWKTTDKVCRSGRVRIQPAHTYSLQCVSLLAESELLTCG
jgi:hypothetical protein